MDGDKQVCICLSTALVTTIKNSKNKEERISQYVDGIKYILDKYSNQIDIYLVDNTLSGINDLPAELIEQIKRISGNRLVVFSENEYGKINKGAGLIAQWRKLIQCDNFKYTNIIHFEPRQKIINDGFINQYLKEKGNRFREDFYEVNRFCYKKLKIHFQTGLLGMETRILTCFINEIDVNKMVRRSLSIEDLLYRFIKKNKIKYSSVKSLGVVWHSDEEDLLL